MTHISSKQNIGDDTTLTREKVFIGVSWPYASANIHIGHLAGQYASCDVFARYHRLAGNQVLIVSGSDCHGAAVLFYAEEQNLKPKELADKSHKAIQKTYEKLGLLYDNYTRTDTETHKVVVQNLFSALKEFGYLKVKESEQYYDKKVKRFLPDRYVRGTCPKCGATNARGTECPECGAFLKPTDLLEPYSTLSDTSPIIKKTKHFYLDLTKAEGHLLKWINSKNSNHWRKWVKEFSKGFIKTGLHPRAITRDLKYGIKIPVSGWDDKVIYVWFEAVIGYLSAAIEWAKKTGDPSKWESFWKDPNCKHYYFIAGGNAPFHTIIWPTELMAYNEKYTDSKLFKRFKLPGETQQNPLQLPFDVPANKMLLHRGKKMSKGDKTGIKLEDLIGYYHPDLIRFFFIRYAPENHDREFTWRDFIEVNNHELVGNLGNFVNRTLTFVVNKYSGRIPKGDLEPKVQEAIEIAFTKVGQNIEGCKFIKASEDLLALGDFANKYFNDNKPWETIKSRSSTRGKTQNCGGVGKRKEKEADECIYNCVQIIGALTVLVKPFMPFTSHRLRNLLNMPDVYDPNDELEATGFVSDNKVANYWVPVSIKGGYKIKDPALLFEKLEYTKELQKVDGAK